MDQVAAVTDVVFRRGETVILDHVSLAMHEGERWPVLGPNGAGKTTLLSLFAAKEHPTSGTVDVLGKRLGKYAIQQLWPHIGNVHSRHRPAFRMTTREVIYSGLTGANATPHKWEPDPDVARLAQSLEDELGISHISDHWWETLSTGEQRRTLLARALVNAPSYLLLDEPASGLDFGGREQLLAVLDELAAGRPQLASIIVTHHLEELPASTTHAALLSHGGLVATGPVRDVLRDALVSDCFGMPIVVREHEGRWSATASRG